MATFLDVTGLQHFTNVFVFLFVWLVVFAVISLSKVLGHNKFIHALVSLLFAIFVLLSPVATTIVGSSAPFLAVVFLFVVVLSAAAKMLGTDIGEFPALRGVFLIFIVLILIIAAGVKIRENADVPTEAQKDLSKTINLVFHPVFMGAVLVLAISVFTIALLTSKSV